MTVFQTTKGVLATGSGSIVASAASIVASVALNGGSAVLTVFEDTDGDGVAENSVQHQLSNGANEYGTDSLSLNEGNTLWYVLETDNATVADTVSVDYIEVEY